MICNVKFLCYGRIDPDARGVSVRGGSVPGSRLFSSISPSVVVARIFEFNRLESGRGSRLKIVLRSGNLCVAIAGQLQRAHVLWR